MIDHLISAELQRRLELKYPPDKLHTQDMSVLMGRYEERLAWLIVNMLPELEDYALDYTEQTGR